MQGAASGGYGSYSSMSSGSNCFTIDICPDLLLAAIAAAAAAAFYLIYQAITMAMRRKRSLSIIDTFDTSSAFVVFELLHLGMILVVDGP